MQVAHKWFQREARLFMKLAIGAQNQKYIET